MPRFQATIPVTFEFEVSGANEGEALSLIETWLQEKDFKLDELNWSCDKPQDIEVKLVKP